MLTRKINNSILISAHSSRFFLQMWCAILLAKFVWWIITPAYNEVYVDRVRINQKDSSVKYIINRYPFGEVVIVKAKDNTPAFSTLVKLHGVYMSGDDSMAFVEFNDKNKAVRIDGKISPNISLTKVLPDSIIITQNGVDATIKLTRSAAVANSSSFGANNLGRMSGYQPPNNLNNTSDNTNLGAGSASIPNTPSDLMEKRKELIEKFAKQELNDDNMDNSSRKPNTN